MDQTDASLLAGFLVGSHLGAFGLRHLTGWSLWITYPTGGVFGFLVVAGLAQFAIGRLRKRSGT